MVIYISTNIDFSLLKDAFYQIRLSFYIISTLIALVCPIILAFKYSILIKNTSLSISIHRIVVVNFISRFYALFLPSALGTEMVRWYKITKNKKGKSHFLAATILERIFFLLVLITFGSIPLFFYSDNLQIITLRHRLVPLLSVMFFFLFLGLVFFIFPRLQTIIKSLIINCLLIKKGSKFHQLLVNFEIKQSIISIICPLLCLSILWQSLFLLRMFFLFHSLNLSLGFFDISWICSLVLLLQIIPISFAGIGIRESAYAYFFPMFGLLEEKGIIIGILFFSQMLIFSLIGAVLNFFEHREL